jgi:hypothetical protein
MDDMIKFMFLLSKSSYNAYSFYYEKDDGMNAVKPIDGRTKAARTTKFHKGKFKR